ncbi:hypothetical protein M3Y94_00986700 [Aphelenchoides besseyi]|nr:hypothetical protein M3Y94_00986700 [Aphelenchoides besseyi]KAI6221108.1 hypothetical protein M3Y95_01006100 [Aphelenchoides besseyi]
MSSPASKHFRSKWSFEDEESKKEKKKDASKKKSKCKRRNSNSKSKKNDRSQKKSGRSPSPVHVRSMTNIPEWPPGCSTNASTACNHKNEEEEKKCWRKNAALSAALLNAMRHRSSSSGRQKNQQPVDRQGQFGNSTPVVSPAPSQSTPAKSTPVTPVQSNQEAEVMEIDEFIRQHFDGKKDEAGQPINVDWYLSKKGLKHAEKKVEQEEPKKPPAKDSEKQPAIDNTKNLQLFMNSMLVGNGFTLRIQQPTEPNGLATLHLDAKVDGISNQPVVQQPQQPTSKPSDTTQAPVDPKSRKAAEHKPNN